MPGKPAPIAGTGPISLESFLGGTIPCRILPGASPAGLAPGHFPGFFPLISSGVCIMCYHSQSTFIFYLIRCSEAPQRASGTPETEGPGEGRLLIDLLRLCLWPWDRVSWENVSSGPRWGSCAAIQQGAAESPLPGRASEGSGESGACCGSLPAGSETNREILLEEHQVWS